MGKALQRTGYVPIALEATDNDGPAFTFSPILESSCGQAGFTNLEANWNPKVPIRTSWTSLCVLNALNTLAAYAKSGLFGANYATENENEADALFANQKAAMLVTGSWEAATLVSEHVRFPFSWTTFPAVTRGAEPQMQSFALDALGVNSASRMKGLAIEFLKFLASKEVNSQPAIQENLPGLEPRTDVNFEVGIPGALVEQKVAATKTIGEVACITVAVPWEASINQELLDMLSGQASAQSVAQDFAGLNSQARSNPNQ